MSKIKYFGAEWCSQCNFMKPIVKEWAEENEIEVEYYNAEEISESELNIYEIMTLPTILNIENNKRIVGACNKDKLNEIIR